MRVPTRLEVSKTGKDQEKVQTPENCQREDQEDHI